MEPTAQSLPRIAVNNLSIDYFPLHSLDELEIRARVHALTYLLDNNDFVKNAHAVRHLARIAYLTDDFRAETAISRYIAEGEIAERFAKFPAELQSDIIEILQRGLHITWQRRRETLNVSPSPLIQDAVELALCSASNEGLRLLLFLADEPGLPANNYRAASRVLKLKQELFRSCDGSIDGLYTIAETADKLLRKKPLRSCFSNQEESDQPQRRFVFQSASEALFTSRHFQTPEEIGLNIYYDCVAEGQFAHIQFLRQLKRWAENINPNRKSAEGSK